MMLTIYMPNTSLYTHWLAPLAGGRRKRHVVLGRYAHRPSCPCRAPLSSSTGPTSAPPEAPPALPASCSNATPPCASSHGAQPPEAPHPVPPPARLLPLPSLPPLPLPPLPLPPPPHVPNTTRSCAKRLARDSSTMRGAEGGLRLPVRIATLSLPTATCRTAARHPNR